MADQDDNTDDQQHGGNTIGDRISDDDARRLLNRTSKDSDDGDQGGHDKDDDEPLGDSGKRALERERLDRKRAAERASKAEKERDELAAKVREFEQATQSETERLQGDRDTYKSRFESADSELRRLRIAMASAPEHATLAQMAKVAKRMHGDDDDALTEDAKELWDDYAPAPPKTPAGKPKERLQGGGEPPQDADKPDRKSILAAIPRSRF